MRCANCHKDCKRVRKADGSMSRMPGRTLRAIGHICDDCYRRYMYGDKD